MLSLGIPRGLLCTLRCALLRRQAQGRASVHCYEQSAGA